MTPSGIEPATFRLVAAVPQPTALPRAIHAPDTCNKSKGRDIIG